MRGAGERGERGEKSKLCSRPSRPPPGGTPRPASATSVDKAISSFFTCSAPERGARCRRLGRQRRSAAVRDCRCSSGRWGNTRTAQRPAWQGNRLSTQRGQHASRSISCTRHCAPQQRRSAAARALRTHPKIQVTTWHHGRRPHAGGRPLHQRRVPALRNACKHRAWYALAAGVSSAGRVWQHKSGP